MGLTFQMSPILTQAERAAWAEALSSWCLWGNPRSPVWLELRVRREKRQKTRLKRKEGPEPSGPIGCVKVFSSVLRHWEPVCKCHTEGHDGFCLSTLATCREWLGEASWYMETRWQGPAMLFCFLAWDPDEGRVGLPCYRKPQALLDILFSVFSSGQHKGSLFLLCSPRFLWPKERPSPSTSCSPESAGEALAAGSGQGSLLSPCQPFHCFDLCWRCCCFPSLG